VRRYVFVLVLLVLIPFLKLRPLTAEIFPKIEGIVVEKDSGQPLLGVFVKLYRYDRLRKHRHCIKHATTNPKGYFAINDIYIYNPTYNSFFLGFSKQGYVSVIPDELARLLKLEELGRELSLQQGENLFVETQLERGGSLRVNILKKEGNGMSPFNLGSLDVYVSLKHDDQWLKYDNKELKLDGQVVFDSLPPGGEFLILATYGGLPPVMGNVIIQKGKEATFTHIYDLTDRTGISGNIAYKGKPYYGAHVYLRRFRGKHVSSLTSCRRSEKSDYRFLNLEPGTYELLFAMRYDSEEDLDKRLIVEVKKGRTTILNVDFHRN
jgi:hypothetical protein